MAKFSQTPQYSNNFANGVSKALELHKYQIRKDNTPYAAHLLKVCGECLRLGYFIDSKSTVAEQLLNSSGLSNLGELTALAGVFHDTLEDIPNMSETMAIKLLTPRLGKYILPIVKEVSENENLSGFEAKEHYANKIAGMSTFALIVSIVDKCDNIEGYYNLLCRRYSFDIEAVIKFYKLLLPAYKNRIKLGNPTLKKNLEEKLNFMAQNTCKLIAYTQNSQS